MNKELITFIKKEIGVIKRSELKPLEKAEALRFLKVSWNIDSEFRYIPNKIQLMTKTDRYHISININDRYMDYLSVLDQFL